MNDERELGRVGGLLREKVVSLDNAKSRKDDICIIGVPRNK